MTFIIVFYKAYHCCIISIFYDYATITIFRHVISVHYQPLDQVWKSSINTLLNSLVSFWHRVIIDKCFQGVLHLIFQCKHCGKAFASHAAHDSHVRRTHTKTDRGGGGGATCAVCARSFSQIYELKFHMRTHNGGWKWVYSFFSFLFYCNTFLRNHGRTIF